MHHVSSLYVTRSGIKGEAIKTREGLFKVYGGFSEDVSKLNFLLIRPLLPPPGAHFADMHLPSAVAPFPRLS